MTGSERGFTIIEVVLFLAITGGLFAVLMIGVSVGVTQQRYLDSVRSYKALLQDQYIAAVNTRNEATDAFKCDDSNDGSVVGADSRDPHRGTSSCVILGRAIQVVDDGGKTQIITSSVTGYDPGDQSSGTSDLVALSDYRPKLALFDKEMTTIDWDAQLTKAESIEDSNLATAVILILRSPVSGSVVVYTSQTALNGSLDLASLFDATSSQNTQLVKSCLSGDSGLLPKQMIVIDPKVGGPDAVSTDGGRSEVCQR